MENSNDSGKVIGALLVGAAIGGALGLLFAPEKGSTTRRKIMDESNDITDVLTEKFNDFLAGFKKEMDNVKDKANEFTHSDRSKEA